MLSREFKKIYHPRMEPMKSVASKVFKTVAKPFAKKAIKAGVSQAGTKVGKMAADKAIEKSGKLITKDFQRGTTPGSAIQRGTRKLR